MENLRFFLLCVIALLGFILYQNWQADYAGRSNSAPSQQTKADTNENTGAAPSTVGAANDNATNVPPGRADGQQDSGTRLASDGGASHGPLVRVVTDKYNLWIDRKGGDLYRVKLRDVPVSSAQPDTPLTLINAKSSDFFRQTSRIIASSHSAPTLRTYKTKQSTYRLGEDQDTLVVPLTWTKIGHTIKKIYTFKRGSYRVALDNKVANRGDTPWTVSNYVRFWRSSFDTSNQPWFIPATFSGVGWYERKNDDTGFVYHSRKPDALANNTLDLTQKGGWVALIQHYFITAAIPDRSVTTRFFARPKAADGAPSAYVAGFRTAQQRVASGSDAEFNTTLFVGPKLQSQLTGTAPGLDLTVNYGWMTVLAKPIFEILSFLHSWVANWGVAIILLTLIIKLCFYKLSEKQFRAMARMRKFQPRMQQLKEQYGDDRQQLQAKMMELYKKEGFNPLAGCWPMLIQAPVFIVLYWVLLESAEMRSAPFLWINDLSAPDPYYILPIFFGVTMFVQQRLTMTTAMDPIQQRMMQIMPLGLAIFFTFFPAGLVLYWCTNNALTIAQQWYIYRKLDSEGLGHKAQSG